MNVLLSPTGQSQLSQLKAANNLPLNRLDAKSQALTTKKGLVDGADKAVEALKTSLTALKSANATLSPAATADFIQKFNSLQAALKTQTAKGTVLSSVSVVRQVRSELRSPFQSQSVLDGLKAAGIATTQDGLVATSNPTAVVMDDVTYTSMLDNLTKLSTKLSHESDGEAAQLATITKQRARTQIFVDRTNVRTETNFLKMYNVMQNLTSSTGTALINSLG